MTIPCTLAQDTPLPSSALAPAQPSTGAALTALLGLSAKLALAQLAPMLASLYLARLVARQGALLFSSYSLVNAINIALFIAASSFLQALYFIGGRALGQDRRANYDSAILAGLALAGCIGMGSVVLSMAIGPILSALDMDRDLVALAGKLGLVAACGIPPVLLLVVYRVHAALNERAGLVALMSVGGTALTLVLAALWLRWGSAGPEHTVLGIAASMVLANWIMLGAAALCWRMLPELRFGSGALAAARAGIGPALRSLAAVGWPIGAVVFLDSMASLVSSMLVSRYWLALAPLHVMVLLWVTLALIVPLGIAQAAVQRVALTHAQGRLAQRNAIVRAALLLMAAYSVLIIAAFSLWPFALAQLLLGPQVLAPALLLQLPQMMFLGSVLLALQGVVVIGAALLRGIGQTRAPLVQAFIGYAVIATGAQILLGPVLGYGLAGVWWGLVSGFGATAVAVLLYCKKEFRLSKAVMEKPAAPAAHLKFDPSSLTLT